MYVTLKEITLNIDKLYNLYCDLVYFILVYVQLLMQKEQLSLPSLLNLPD